MSSIYATREKQRFHCAIRGQIHGNQGLFAPKQRKNNLFAPTWCSDSVAAVFLLRSTPLNLLLNRSMDELKAILARAKARAMEKNLPYAGALLPAEANAILEADSDARLVDVRTQAELDWVGRVPGALTIEWNSWPEGERNPRFIEQVKDAAPSVRAPLMFLCRSGARSHHAAIAATQAGCTNCFNVLEGFEGDKDEDGHRNRLGGWRAAGLPWVQS